MRTVGAGEGGGLYLGVDAAGGLGLNLGCGEVTVPLTFHYPHVKNGGDGARSCSTWAG